MIGRLRRIVTQLILSDMNEPRIKVDVQDRKAVVDFMRIVKNYLKMKRIEEKK